MSREHFIVCAKKRKKSEEATRSIYKTTNNDSFFTHVTKYKANRLQTAVRCAGYLAERKN